jgi:hypothetical protein
MFIDRVPELAFLNAVLKRQHPGPGQFVMLYSPAAGRQDGAAARLG